MANPEHLAILKEGMKIWNRWRKDQPNITPDFQEAELSCARLTGMDLRRVNLSRACLFEANLFEADLSEANISAANLYSAAFHGANLTRANLCEAELTGVELSYSDLSGTHLSSIKGWEEISDMELANVYGVQNPPDGFVEWATKEKGAVSVEFKNEWEKIVAEATEN